MSQLLACSSLVKDSRQKIGWVPKISFKIGLNPRDKILLERIMAFGTPADDWSNAFLIFLRPVQLESHANYTV